MVKLSPDGRPAHEERRSTMARYRRFVSVSTHTIEVVDNLSWRVKGNTVYMFKVLLSLEGDKVRTVSGTCCVVVVHWWFQEWRV